MRLAIFIETAGNFAGLIGTEENRLVLAGFGVAGIEVGDNLMGGLEHFGAFKGGLGDREFTMRTAVMKSEVDLGGFMIPIE